MQLTNRLRLAWRVAPPSLAITAALGPHTARDLSPAVAIFTGLLASSSSRMSMGREACFEACLLPVPGGLDTAEEPGRAGNSRETT
mmetsp:Transcript_25508/g.45262  ORF Transcript_25508/g.45262 Transcript_25508/m.45262 type:complete len:86 (+) Transcript_25508:310-567(+)